MKCNINDINTTIAPDKNMREYKYAPASKIIFSGAETFYASS